MGLRLRRNPQLDPSVQGRHLDFAAEGRLHEGDRNVAQEVHAVAAEDRVFAYRHLHVEISRRAAVRPGFALAGQANSVPFVDACGYVDGQRLAPLDATAAATGAAGVGDECPGAAALGARLLQREKSLGDANLALAVTLRTGAGAGAGGGAAAAAVIAHG